MSASFCKGLVKIQLILDLEVGQPICVARLGQPKNQCLPHYVLLKLYSIPNEVVRLLRTGRSPSDTDRLSLFWQFSFNSHANSLHRV